MPTTDAEPIDSTPVQWKGGATCVVNGHFATFNWLVGDTHAQVTYEDTYQVELVELDQLKKPAIRPERAVMTLAPDAAPAGQTDISPAEDPADPAPVEGKAVIDPEQTITLLKQHLAAAEQALARLNRKESRLVGNLIHTRKGRDNTLAVISKYHAIIDGLPEWTKKHADLLEQE